MTLPPEVKQRILNVFDDSYDLLPSERDTISKAIDNLDWEESYFLSSLATVFLKREEWMRSLGINIYAIKKKSLPWYVVPSTDSYVSEDEKELLKLMQRFMNK